MRRMTWLAAGVLPLLLAATLVQMAGAAGPDPVAGVPGSQIGVHGPDANFTSGLEVVAHSPIKLPGETRDGIGNNGAPTLIGNCAYVGRWHDYRTVRGAPQHGVQIVDIDPASGGYMQVVGEVAGSFADGATSREIRAVDLPGFKLLVVMTFSDALATRPDRELETLRLFDFPDGDCRAPRLAGLYNLVNRPHEFFLWADPDPAHNVAGHPRLLAYVATPITAPNLRVIDISDPALPRLAAVFEPGFPIVSPEEPDGTFLGTYLHSVSVSGDGTRAYLSYWDGGFLTVDTTTLALGLPVGAVLPLGLASVPYDYSPPDFGNTHSTVRAPGRDFVVTGDEIYVPVGGCPYGWLRTVAIGSPTEAPHQLGEYRLAENRPENCSAATDSVKFKNSSGLEIDGTFSMHNQTVLDRFALVSWYGGGMRVIDLADPAHPSEAGFFVPAPLATVREPTFSYAGVPLTGTANQNDDWWVETWSYPVVRDGLIYVTDIRNGLYILRPAPGAAFAADIAATRLAEGNSNVGVLAGA